MNLAHSAFHQRLIAHPQTNLSSGELSRLGVRLPEAGYFRIADHGSRQLAAVGDVFRNSGNRQPIEVFGGRS
jgi:hypothetical protein